MVKQRIITGCICAMLFISGCGHKTRLTPPEPRRLERVTSVKAELQCGKVVINWKPVFFDTRGNPLEKPASYLILRRRGTPLAKPKKEDTDNLPEGMADTDKANTENLPENSQEMSLEPEIEDPTLSVEYDFSLIDIVPGIDVSLNDPDWMKSSMNWVDDGKEAGPIWTPQKKHFKKPKGFAPDNDTEGSGLLGASTVYYMIVAVGADNTTSEPSENVSIPWIYIPAAPENLEATVQENNVVLSWTAADTDCYGSVVEPQSNFEVYRREATHSDDTDFSLIKMIDQPEFKDESIVKDTVFEYKVRAFIPGLGVSGEFTEPLTVDTTDNFAPAIPQNLTGAISILGVHLNWRQVSDADIAGYRLYRRESESQERVLLNPDTLIVTNTFTDETAVRGKSYDYMVSSVDDSTQANESEPGNTWSIKIK